MEASRGRLSEEQLRQYKDEGFVVVGPDFFSREELEPVIQEIAACVDLLAKKLYAAGKIQDKHEDKGFYERLGHIEKQFPGAPVLIHTMGKLGPELTKVLN